MSKRQQKRQRTRRFIPTMGRLEDRTVPAGNVTAFVFDGTLYVGGDAAGNRIWISATGNNRVEVRSLDGTTTINGQAGAVPLSGIRRGFHVVLGDGDDTLQINGVDAYRHFNIDLGNGTDLLNIFDVRTYRNDVHIVTGPGGDGVQIVSSQFYSDAVIDTGDGDDIAIVTSNEFFGDALLNGGGGANQLNTAGTNFHRSPMIANFNNGIPQPPVQPPPSTAPVANDDRSQVQQGGTVTINVAANDMALTGTLNLASVTITGAPMFGTATSNGDGTVTYSNTNTNTTSHVDMFRYTIRDSAGTVSNEATVMVVLLDVTAPTVSITTTATDPTSMAPIPFTFTFSEDISGFTESDVTVTNGTVALLTRLDLRTYRVDVDPTGDGAVSVSLPANAVQDTSGNGNLASNTVTIGFDTTAPVLTINTLVTNDSTPTITGTVDDPNATISVTVGGQTFNATVSGTTWTATVPNPLADGTYTIMVSATDAAGNMGSQTSVDGLLIDTAAPTATITTTEPDPSPAETIPFRVTFSEPVTGFTASGLTVTNGTVSNFTTVDAMTFTFDVTPTADGLVTVTVNAGAAQDAAGNSNPEATFSITSQRQDLTPLIATTASDPTNLSPIPFTVTFNRDVTGFDETDLQVVNGTVSNFVMVDARTFTFDVTPTADGLVTVTVPAGVAMDSFGKLNTEATFSITSDQTAPAAPVITGLDPSSDSGTPGDGLTNDNTPTFVGTAEAGATVTLFADGGTGPVSLGTTVADANGDWSFTPADALVDGTYTITATATDPAGNVSAISAGFALTIDTTAPAATITTTEPDPTGAATIPFTVTFDSDVTGFSASGITVANGTVSNFVMVDARTFTFDVAPAGDGLVTVTVNAGAAQDAAGNDNLSVSFSITSERFAPTETITTTASDPTNLSPIPFTVTFSENVTGFSEAGLMVLNGTVSNFVMVDARTYTFDVTPLADGLVTVKVLAGSAQDNAGNQNSEATFTITSDRTPPATPTIIGLTPASDSGTAGDGITNDTTPTLQGSADAGSMVRVIATSGSDSIELGVVTADANGKWVLTVSTALADGTYTITATASDAAGNVSPASAGFTLVIDATAPTPTITTTAPNPTNQSPIPFTVTFSEDVTGFSAGGLNVTNGIVSNFVMVNARTYTFDVTPLTDGPVTVKVNMGSAQDAAGNTNTGTTFVITSDRTTPAGTINPAATGGVISGTASDLTSGVTSVAISIFNGTMYWDGTGFNSATEVFLPTMTTDNFANWSFAFTQTGSFTVRARITDGAGNENTILSLVIVP